MLPNAWDAASARIIAQAGCQAIARITQVVECPVTADVEAGYGTTIDAVLATVRGVIATGACARRR
ncbi:MAG: hypothetical protein PVSMB4_17810 [Ktedonobacterales bacterium]